MIGFLLGSFFGLLAIGLPVAFVLIVMAMSVYAGLDFWQLFLQIPQRLFSPMENTLYLAIPFFILTGEIMNRSQITDKIMDLASSMVGFMRGGLAHTNIMASILFAGITGSAVSDTVAIGSIMMPAMKKEGYPADFSAAVTASSSVIGPIIPPSIPFLIYASVMKVSVAGLFLGGIIPGLLVGLSLMAISYYLCRKNGYGAPRKFVGIWIFCRNFLRAIPALLMPVIIMGGILGGWFSPTGASAIAAVYALAVGVVYYRTLKLKDLVPILRVTLKSSAMIMFILGSAQIFAWLVTYFQLVQHVANAVLAIVHEPWTFLLLINGILLIVGMFLDMSFSIIVLGPLFGPVATTMGIDPIQFGLIMCVNLTIGLATPPFGLCLFGICGVDRDVSMSSVSKAILPFVGAEIIALLLVTYIPPVTMYLPKLFGYA